MCSLGMTSEKCGAEDSIRENLNAYIDIVMPSECRGTMELSRSFGGKNNILEHGSIASWSFRLDYSVQNSVAL